MQRKFVLYINIYYCQLNVSKKAKLLSKEPFFHLPHNVVPLPLMGLWKLPYTHYLLRQSASHCHRLIHNYVPLKYVTKLKIPPVRYRTLSST